MSLIKKRMLEYLEKRGISKYKCYKDTGITRGVLDAKSGITEDNIIKFVNFYPDVDLNWLIRGVGEIPFPEYSGIGNREVNKGERKSDTLKDELLRLLTVDEDIQKAFKYIIGKEINTFTSQKLLTLVNDKNFFDAISAHLNKSKLKDK